jgi:hypothetical protein
VMGLIVWIMTMTKDECIDEMKWWAMVGWVGVGDILWRIATMEVVQDIENNDDTHIPL